VGVIWLPLTYGTIECNLSENFKLRTPKPDKGIAH